MDLLLLTVEDSADAVLPSLSLLPHRVRTLPAETSSLTELGDAEVILVDARRDLAGARGLCRLLGGGRARLGAVLTEGGLVAITADWGIDDFLLPETGPAELDARLRLLVARGAAGGDEPDDRVTLGELVIDEATYTARLREAFPLGAGVTIERSRIDDAGLRALTRRAHRVVDCRGARPGPGIPMQTAYGIVLPAADAAPALGGDPALFMDWRTDHDDDELGPTFLYAIPVGPTRVLLEETCLAGDPAPAPAVLARRLRSRLLRRGVAEEVRLEGDHAGVDEEEVGVLVDERGRGDDGVSLALEEGEPAAPDLGGVHRGIHPGTLSGRAQRDRSRLRSQVHRSWSRASNPRSVGR